MGLINNAQYNGNISAIEWRTPKSNAIGSPSGKQAYGFGYDALNRLIAADYGEGSNFATNPNAFNVSGIKYDLNGNIMNLNREMAIESSNTVFASEEIDKLVYKYAGNQLLNVSDAANASITDKNNKLAKNYGFKDGASSKVEYQYDLNGNMVRDNNKGLANVEYNYLNLPKTLTGRDNKTILYIYDANGQKLAKTAAGKTTYYAGNIIYEEASLQYLLHAEGKYDFTASAGQYQFDLKDHLGNVRMVVDVNGTELQQSAYYPFGMAFQKGGNTNKYLYNGKELQEDKINNENLDWYDYGARFYDPALGRFTTVDPWAEKYVGQSPYLYAHNNPIRYTDLLGLGAEDEVKNKVTYSYTRIDKEKESHTLTHTQNQTYENVSKDGNTKTVDNVTTTTRTVITKETTENGNVISTKTSAETMQSVDVTSQTYTKGENGEWVSNNDAKTTNVASNSLGDEELGSVNLPSGWKLNVGLDGTFNEMVSGTMDFVHNSEFGDNMIDNSVAWENVSKGAGITATVAGVAMDVTSRILKTAKWVGRVGRAATYIGAFTLIGDAVYESQKENVNSKTLREW